MTKIALQGLLARKLRAGLTALAIVLGVAMASGTFVLTDTISQAFDEIFTDSNKGSDAVITGKKVVEGSHSSEAAIAESLLGKVRDRPKVAAAAGAIEASAKISGKDGRAITTRGSPTLGYGIDFTQQRFNSLKLARGAWPKKGEVAIDKTTADEQGFKVGQQVGISAVGPSKKYRLAGVVTFGDSETLADATIAAFDLATAQEVFDKKDVFDSIVVDGKAGVEPEELVKDLRPLLTPSIEAKTAEEQAESDAERISESLAFVEYFLLAFSAIALFVGAFVIFNTLAITVAQRIREFATMRTLGAQRRQVLGSVVLEMFVIGVVASLAGLLLGVGLAALLKRLLARAGVELPSTALVIAPRTILISLVTGTLIALLAGLVPAVRATRVPPIAAVREGATLPPGRFAPLTRPIAAGAVAVALAVIAAGMYVGDLATTARLLLLGVGTLLLFAAITVLSPPLVRPLALALGRPAERLGGMAGQLARENTARAPERTAATAAALMIGLALVTFVSVLGAGLQASITDTLEKQLLADYVAGAHELNDGFPVATGASVGKAKKVELANQVRGDAAKVGKSEEVVTGIAPATIGRVFRFEWQEGSDAVLSQLGSKGAIVTDTFADGEKRRVGSKLKIVTAANKSFEVEVKGIYKAPALGSVLGSVSLSRRAFDAEFPRPTRNRLLFIAVDGEASAAAAAAIEKALEPYPDVALETRDEFIESQQASITTLLAMLYVLLALSVIVSLFGMVNTLALSVFERTRELGMLRAIGMSPRQVRRMVRHESIITALIGATFGLPLGVFLAALVTSALEDFGIVFSLPVVSLAIFAVIAVVAGVAAAILPARRASRLNVLEALQYE